MIENIRFIFEYIIDKYSVLGSENIKSDIPSEYFCEYDSRCIL